MAPLPSPSGTALLWIAVSSRRSVVAAHLDHVAGRFAAEGWAVHRGPEPPSLPESLGADPHQPVAVLGDPWIEPFPAAAQVLASVPVEAGSPEAHWRVPRLTGLDGPQGWAPRRPPWTLRQAETRAVERGAEGRPATRRGSLHPGFAVAPAAEAHPLLSHGGLPTPDRCALASGVRFFRYRDPADHERREIVPWVPDDARLVVDVGCGHGALGAQLRRPGRLVVGVEPDPAMALVAGRRLDAVLLGRAEDALPALGQPIDCLIFADVLEHLVAPEVVLRRARDHLAADGVLVASVPNSAWAPILHDLAAGRWDPTLAGVQARDHLRPFTPESFRRMAEECGFRVERWQPLPAPLPWRLRLWAWLAARTAGGRPEALAAPQWLACLKVSRDPGS